MVWTERLYCMELCSAYLCLSMKGANAPKVRTGETVVCTKQSHRMNLSDVQHQLLSYLL